MPRRTGSAKGAHVNAAGANSGDRREVDAETVLRAAVKVTDHVEQAKVEAGEFRDLVAAGKLAWSDIRELGELVTGKAKGRTSPSDLTLFKSLGIALEDVAFAELVYQRALAAGVGGRCRLVATSALRDRTHRARRSWVVRMHPSLRRKQTQNAPLELLRNGRAGSCARSEPSSWRSAAMLELPALRRAHELPAVRGHAMDAEALAAAVVGDLDRIALGLRHQDLQIGRDHGGIAVDRDVRQAGEMREPACDRGLVAGLST